MLCGPIVLAGLTHGPRTIIGDPARPHDWLRPVPASAASELRSLRLGGGGPPGGASGGYVAVGASGLRVVTSKALPKPPAFNAPDATWRRVCYPSAYQCERVALEHFTQPGSWLSVPPISGVEAQQVRGHQSSLITRSLHQAGVEAQQVRGEGEAGACMPAPIASSRLLLDSLPR